MVAKVMMKTGLTMQEWSMIYKVEVQTVMLYRSKIWVVTDLMLNVLEGFHHRVYWRIVGISDWKFGEG